MGDRESQSFAAPPMDVGGLLLKCMTGGEVSGLPTPTGVSVPWSRSLPWKTVPHGVHAVLPTGGNSPTRKRLFSSQGSGNPPRPPRVGLREHNCPAGRDAGRNRDHSDVHGPFGGLGSKDGRDKAHAQNEHPVTYGHENDQMQKPLVGGMDRRFGTHGSAPCFVAPCGLESLLQSLDEACTNRG